MDSREPPQPPNVMVGLGPNSYPNTLGPSMMAPATARFPPFNNNNNNTSPHSEPFNNDNNNNSNNDKPCGLAATVESAKKKRGRPRKYSPSNDGNNIALGLAQTHTSPSSAKKSRGRPPGSGKKQLDALGTGGTCITPHVIYVENGEDVAAKVMAFCQQGRSVCIMSATGATSNVILRQPTAGGIVTYEGLYEIISLSGRLQLPENNSGRTGISDLIVSIGGLDGRVVGGKLVGKLTAASTVQVVVACFIADGKKSSSNNAKSGPSSMTPSSQMLTFGASVTPTSPTSQGPSTESSDDNENSTFSKAPGLYNNASQPIHTMPVYHHPLWAGQTQQ